VLTTVNRVPIIEELNSLSFSRFTSVSEKKRKKRIISKKEDEKRSLDRKRGKRGKRGGVGCQPKMNVCCL
jgi:hypothetical protein